MTPALLSPALLFPALLTLAPLSPAPLSPAPQSPAPLTPAPRTLAPQTLARLSLDPLAPAPLTPALQSLAPLTLALQSLAPLSPAPLSPAPLAGGTLLEWRACLSSECSVLAPCLVTAHSPGVHFTCPGVWGWGGGGLVWPLPVIVLGDQTLVTWRRCPPGAAVPQSGPCVLRGG